MYKKVFGITARLSDLLQAKSIDLGNAAIVIQAVIDSFEKMRSDSEWELLWEEGLALFNHVCGNVEQPRRQRQRQLSSALSDSVINETIGTSHLRSDFSCESFRSDLYYPTLDNILKEMKLRFADINLSLMKSIDSLHPHSQNFLQTDVLEELLKQYNVPCDGLKEEVLTFRNYLERLSLSQDNNRLHDILEVLLPVQEAFPTITKAVIIAMTFGTSTATVERTFSTLRRILNYLRSTMSQTRLDDLALINIESDLSAKLWDRLPSLVMKFAQVHKNSKIPLL